MCQPAVPHAMKRGSTLCHSVRRVPPAKASSSHLVSLYSSTLGASARVTRVSIGLGAPAQVSFTVPLLSVLFHLRPVGRTRCVQLAITHRAADLRASWTS